VKYVIDVGIIKFKRFFNKFFVKKKNDFLKRKRINEFKHQECFYFLYHFADFFI
jgi:hypothetical protein